MFFNLYFTDYAITVVPISPFGPLYQAPPTPGLSILQPTGRMQPRMAVNAAQHKIVNLLKTLWDFLVITCHDVLNVWPTDAKRLDTPGSV